MHVSIGEGMASREANVRLMAASWRKQAAGRDGDALWQGLIAKPVAIAAIRQLDPDEESASRLGCARPRRERFSNQSTQAIDLRRIEPAQTA